MSYFTPEQVNQFFPVIGIIKFQGGIIVRRGSNLNLNRQNYLHGRKKIFMVSKRSLSKLALLVRGCGVKFTSLMTLTYGANFPMSGRIAKKHLNHFLIASKRAFGPYEYVWVLEFQERNAVHFHIATTLPEPDVLSRAIFAKMWASISTPYSWWYSRVEEPYGKENFKGELFTDSAVENQHQSLEHWERVRNDDSLHHYFAKYTMKIRQKKVPSHYSDVGRFWAASSGVTLPDGEYFHGNNADVKELASAHGRYITDWDVLPKIILLG
jgi:hypothetical protein